MAKTLPALFLHGGVTINFAVDFQPDPTSPVVGAAYKWAASIFVNSQTIGIPLDTFTYAFDGTHVQVGDWVASSENGRALRIAEIISADPNSLSVILEDVDSYNALIDTSFAQDGSIPTNTCIVFRLNENGFPVLGPLNSGFFPEVAQANLMARFDYIDGYTFPGGGSDFLGTPTDGDYDDGAIKGWQPGVTTIADAFDQLNNIMSKALPPKPTDVADVNLTFTNQSPVVEGTLLANGAHTVQAPGYVPMYLDPITAISSTTTLTNLISDIGTGDYGTISVSLNPTTNVIGTRELTKADDTGTYGALQILADADFPAGTTGIWTAMNVMFGYTIPDGINRFTLAHTITGSTEKLVIVENMLAAPVITDMAASENTSVLVYSSGVPHLTKSSTIKYSMTGENLVGRTFPAANSMGLATIPNIGVSELDYDNAQFPAELDINHGPISVVDEILTLDADNIAATATIQFRARNSFVSTTDTLIDDIFINYMSGTGSFLLENAETLKRVRLGDTDKPEVATIDFATDWNEGSASGLGDLELWEAPIIGGRAICSKTDYSQNYIPVGPNFSNKSDTQYITFKFQSITNRIKLAIQGSYTGMWIKLPGVPQDMPNAANGWFDATKQADFAPTLWPGHQFASDGCLLDMEGGALAYTFGSISSASATDNLILVRFALTGTDSIQAFQVL